MFTSYLRRFKMRCAHSLVRAPFLSPEKEICDITIWNDDDSQQITLHDVHSENITLLKLLCRCEFDDFNQARTSSLRWIIEKTIIRY